MLDTLKSRLKNFDRNTFDKWSVRLILLSWIFLFISMTCTKLYSYDVWWHLATGKYILNNFSIPYTDPFSYTMQGVKWIDSLWLFQVAIYSVYLLGGIPGVILFKVVLLASSFFFVFRSLEILEGRRFSWLIVAFLFCLLLGTQNRFHARPHIVGFFFMSIFWFSIIKYNKTNSVKDLLPILPAQLLWVNSHGSFVVGGFLLLCWLIYEASKKGSQQVKDVFKDPVFKNVFFVVSTAGLLCFVNPYGYNLLDFVLFSHSVHADDALRYIQEWYSVPLSALLNLSPDAHFMQKFLFWAFAMSLLCSLKKRENWAWIIYFGGLTYLVTKHGRFFPLFLFASIPLLFMFIKEYASKRVIFFGISIVMIFSIFFTLDKLSYPYFQRNFGVGTRNMYPDKLVEFIAKHKLPPPIMNFYRFGGYFIWKLYPDYQVFIDGRTPTVYTPDFYWQFRMFGKGSEVAIKKTLEKYQIKTIILKNKKNIKTLRDDFGFQLIGFDNNSYLLIKNEDMTKGIVTLKLYDPAKNFSTLVKECKTNNTLNALEEEIKKISIDIPSQKAYKLLGIIYSDGKKDHSNALSYFRKSLESGEVNAQGFYNLALQFKKLNKLNEAVIYFEKALKLEKKYAAAYSSLASVFFEQKNYEEAEEAIREYIDLKGDSVNSSDYLLAGNIYFELFEIEEALEFFNRALFLTDEPATKKLLYNNIGNCYLGMADYSSARKFYINSLKIDPDFEEALNNIELLKNREKL